MTVLLFCSILMMMVLALFLSVRGELFVSQAYRNQTSALYLAETGLWEAVAQLEVDPTWTDGFKNRSKPGMDGTYSITFNKTGAPFSSLESVNNQDGTMDANYRGSGFVPAGCVSLVVSANVGGQQRDLEALVRVGGGLYPAQAPVMTSGRVDLRGDVMIDGRKGQADPTRVDANVHSNKADPEPDIVVWDGNGLATIDGKVSTVAPNADAIALGSCAPAQGVAPGSAAQSIPDVDILSKIGANRGAPAAIVAPLGTTTLRPLGASQNALYHSGDLTVQGDLVLEGVKLYVDGKLHVNGSITGAGSLYVAGSSTLQGDARIASATPDTIALFSHGNVKLSGFSGTEYMEALAAQDTVIAQAWNQLSLSLEEYQEHLNSGGDGLLPGQSRLNSLAQEIGGQTAGSALSPLPPGRQYNVTGILINRLQAQPNSTAKMRMDQKFEDLNELFFSYTNGSHEELTALANLRNGRIVKGAFDGAVDNFASMTGPERAEVKKLMQGYINSIDYDHLGASYFQGVIFTHGSIYTDSEVTVQGAISAFDNGSQQPTDINGERVNPGDLILQPLTRISYIEEFFKPKDDGGGVGPGGAKVLLWMGR